MNDEMKTLLRAIADDKQMQRFVDGTWVDCTPVVAIYRLSQDMQVRIKPEPKPDFVFHTKIRRLGDAWITFGDYAQWPANIKLTFDGESGDLKSAEVLE